MQAVRNRVILVLFALFAAQATEAADVYAPRSFGEAMAILGVRSKAAVNEIKEAYLRLAKRYFPDLQKSNGVGLSESEAATRFKKVKAAFDYLMPSPPAETAPDPAAEEAKRDALMFLRTGFEKGEPLDALIDQVFKLDNNAIWGPSRWEAGTEFLDEHFADYLAKDPAFSEVAHLWETMETQSREPKWKMAFTKRAAEYLNNKSTTPEQYRRALTYRYRDLSHRKASEKHAYRAFWENREFPAWLDEYERKFPQRADSLPPTSRLVTELADDIAKMALEVSPRAQRSLIPFFEYALPLVPTEERLHVLGDLYGQIQTILSEMVDRRSTNLNEDLLRPIRTEVRAIFAKNSQLAEEYRRKSGFWARWIFRSPPCDDLLGSLAREVL